ncbi:efflux transporter outer membrane subunit [Ideonella sp. B7]|uniref:efflux transporter outer membrane subunit n=1 Tax=Ideonella benzenivorans TaxID=2831643 RepID=UPI001CED9111|nr:efflux transporter outer membrane subunit [Ideonella benzenivorans]MCA6215862.1 efflux transporter outer membrane subunit [Ideonella benzenivorans]
MKLLWTASLSLAVAFGSVACTTVGPDYRPAEPAAPSTWAAPLPHGGKTSEMTHWWNQFNDPTVGRLVAMAEEDSPSLAKAWASIEKARATLQSTHSGGFPSVTASASASRERTADLTQTARNAGFDASWEIDLFGKLRRNEEAAAARVEARTGDWYDARVSLAAEVADTYVQWKACGLLVEAYELELESNAQTETATQAAVRAGLTASADGALARASLASARNTLLDQRAQCDLLVKALVYLTGTDERPLRTLLSSAPHGLPEPQQVAINAVPAEVIRQRPDLGSLERELAAASAEIGAAQAAQYPSLSLSGSVGVSATTGSPSSVWSFGPSISLPIFDGGERQAAVSSAEAAYRSAYAAYRQGVRQIIRDVEEAMVHLDSAVHRPQQAAIAESQYRVYFLATQSNWRAGNVSLLTLEEARRSALSAQIQRITLQRDRVQYWIALYKAVGGGWEPGQVATAPASTPSP